MADVTLRNVKKSFGAVDVIKGVDLQVSDGEFCVFVGPSGCGKSTLLRMIAGLEEISSGALDIDGKDMTKVPPANRGVAMVFQSYALYPHMTVEENIAFGLKMAKVPKQDIEARVSYATKMLQLEALRQRKPGQLSGGQRQRVAIGRAIVREPKVFLFDEPLSNLDAALRVQMRTELSQLHQDLKSTMIYVTHDQIEAMTMADKIVVLSAGRIEQVGSPLELYHRPKNLFVAQFIGSPKMNIVAAQVSAIIGDSAEIILDHGTTLHLPLRGAQVKAGDTVSLGIRPEHLSVSTAGILKATVKLAERLGSETLLHLTGPNNVAIVVRADGLAAQKPGDIVALSLPAACCHLFDEKGHALVNGALI